VLVLKYLVHRPYEFKVYSVSSFLFFFILTCIIFTTQTAASPSSIQSIILSFLDLSKEFVTFIHLLDIQQILFLLHFFIVFFFFILYFGIHCPFFKQIILLWCHRILQRMEYGVYYLIETLCFYSENCNFKK